MLRRQVKPGGQADLFSGSLIAMSSAFSAEAGSCARMKSATRSCPRLKFDDLDIQDQAWMRRDISPSSRLTSAGESLINPDTTFSGKCKTTESTTACAVTLQGIPKNSDASPVLSPRLRISITFS